MRAAARSCAGHPAVFAYSIANEIPPDVVRWSRARAVEDFIDELVAEAKAIDPDCLCTFTNYPPTGISCGRKAWIFFALAMFIACTNSSLSKNYLARLQMIADMPGRWCWKRILGLISAGVAEGEPLKCEILSWQIETAFRA